MIRLEPPGRCWRVVSGEVGVFAVPVGGGQRRLLFTVPAGGVVIGTASAGGWTFVATSLTAGQLEAMEATPLDALRGWHAALRDVAGLGEDDPHLLPALAFTLDARVADEARALGEARPGRTTHADADAHAADATIAGIAGLPPPPGPARTDDLLTVLTHVGAALGVPIRADLALGSEANSRRALARIAHASGLRVRRVTLEGPWWREGGSPLISWTDGVPAALVTDVWGHYQLIQPPLPPARVDAARAAALPSEAFELVRRLPEQPLRTVDLLRFGLVGTRADLLSAVAWGLAATALTTTLPVATGLIVDQVIPDADVGALQVLAAGLLVGVLAAAVMRWAHLVGVQRLSGRATAAAQLALWDRLLRLRLSALRPYAVGEQLAQVRSVTAVSAQLNGLALQMALGGALGLANLCVLAWYNLPLTVVSVVAAVVSVIWTLQPAMSARAASLAMVAARSSVYAGTLQLLGGVSKLQSAGAVDAAVAWWWPGYETQLRHQWKVWVARGRLTLAHAAVPVLASAALFVVGAHQHAQGALSAGGFVAFSSTFSVFLVAVSTLVGAIVDLSGARAEAERAAPLLAATPEVRTGATHPGVLQGDLRLEKVEFRYRADLPPVLDGLSLHIAPGEFVAVVGASGCGKSTLLRLLLGFEAPQQGRIFFDGQDLSGLDLEAVRRQLGVVLQNGRVSAGTIHEAVAGAHHATAAEVWDALEAVALRADVEAFPMGLHTQVGDGGSLLSGGQRQRLLIARALLARPRILLFDEATSALDNRAQATVSANLARLNVTRVVIAHRLSTIQEADRILVLVDGKVAQAGTYAELVDVDGPFRALVARQRK